jgi:hypothetical protein
VLQQSLSIFEHGKLRTLHVDFQEIERLDFRDIVEAARGHRYFLDDATPVRERAEMAKYDRVRA